MIIPAIMVFLLTAPYLVVRAFAAIARRDCAPHPPAAIGLAALFTFTGIGHFILTEPMADMLPPFVPARVPTIYSAGLLAFVMAIGFIVRKYRRIAGWLAAASLVSFFPANIYAAINQVPMKGHAWGPVCLLIRAPLQAVILLWAHWFTIRQPGVAARTNAWRDAPDGRWIKICNGQRTA